MKSVRAVLGAMLVWLLASVASAQAVAGSQLAGVIKDSSGGVLPGALVTIIKTDTAMTRTVTTGADGDVRVPEPSGRSVPVEGRAGRLQHPGPGRHRPAGQHQPDARPDPDRRQHRRAGHCRRQLRDDRDPIHRRRPGHRQPAGHADSAERPAGDRIDLPVGPGHVRAGGRSQHQQELSDRHDLGRRRPGQRHHLHHGRRDPQRSVQQPEPADAVSRCAAGVQGGDQLAAGEIRPSRRVGGEPGDQVRAPMRFAGTCSSSSATTTSTRGTSSRPRATA